MKILFLGYENSSLIDFVKKEDTVWATSERLTPEEVVLWDPDFIISYGYKYILKAPLLERYKNKVINLHISYLPWNRGYHPNFWSFYDDTPKGVTIHLIDEGIDTGQILFQKVVNFAPHEDTLANTYDRLRREIEELFMDSWGEIRSKSVHPLKQNDSYGSFHYKKDLEKYWTQLPREWSTQIKKVEGLRGEHSQK